MLRILIAAGNSAEAIDGIAFADMEHSTKMSGHTGLLELCLPPTCIMHLVL